MTFLEKLDLLAAKMLAEGRMPSPATLVQALLAVGGGAGRVRLARPDPAFIRGTFTATLRGDKTASLAFADHLQEQGVPGAHVVREAVKHTGPDYPEGAYVWRDSISPAHASLGAEFDDGWRWQVHGRLSPGAQREGRNAGKPSPALLSVWHQDESGDTYVRHQTPVFSLAHAVEMTEDWPEEHRKKLLRSLKAHGVPATHDEPLKLARKPSKMYYPELRAIQKGAGSVVAADYLQEHGIPGAHIARADSPVEPDHRRWVVHSEIVPDKDNPREGLSAVMLSGSTDPNTGYSIRVHHTHGVQHETMVRNLRHLHALLSDFPKDIRVRTIRTAREIGMPVGPREEPLKLARDPEVHAHETTVAEEHVHDPAAWMILADHYQDAGEPGAEHLREHGRQLAAGRSAVKHDAATQAFQAASAAQMYYQHLLKTPGVRLYAWIRRQPGDPGDKRRTMPPVLLTRWVSTLRGEQVPVSVSVTPDNVDALVDELHPDDAKLVRERVAKHWALS